MESAEQPSYNLHANVGKSLEQLGHKVPTIPPQEGPVFAEELRGIVEDLGHKAKTDLEQIISGGVTHVRTTESKKPISIARIREGLKNRFLRKKAA